MIYSKTAPKLNKCHNLNFWQWQGKNARILIVVQRYISVLNRGSMFELSNLIVKLTFFAGNVLVA